MQKIEIRELTQQDYDNVVDVFGQKIIKFDMLKFDTNNYNLGAFDGSKLVGIIASRPRSLIKPLNSHLDFFIAYVAVLKTYQNNGIATKLIKLVEDFARKKSFFQISSWSDENAVEMINLALKLKYTMCQAFMYDENYLPSEEHECIKGYYYGKRLD